MNELNMCAAGYSAGAVGAVGTIKVGQTRTAESEYTQSIREYSVDIFLMAKKFAGMVSLSVLSLSCDAFEARRLAHKFYRIIFAYELGHEPAVPRSRIRECRGAVPALRRSFSPQGSLIGTSKPKPKYRPDTGAGCIRP